MHKEYKHIVEDAPIGVLLIHGITSTPNHFRDLLCLIPNNFSIHALLLDGHGKETKDFAKTSMKKWVAQVSQAVEDMAQNHGEIYIVAHSLGTLLAIEQALRTGKITKLFLLDSPLRVFVRPRMIPIAFNLSQGKGDPGDPVLSGFKQSYSIAPDKNLFHYFGWIPRFLELLSKCRKTRKLIHKIKCPTMVFQSGKDELVSIRSCKYFETHPNISLAVLPNSGHCYYTPEDLALLQKEFSQFIS